MSTYTDTQIERRPIEARIIRKIIRSLKAAGSPIVSIWDGEEKMKVRTEAEILEGVFNLDEAVLYTESGSYVFVVMGQSWDTLTDYTLDLEEALKPVDEYIDKYGD